MTWTCPKCGKPNLMEQTHCNNCGTSRPYNYHRVVLKKPMQIPKVDFRNK